MKQLKEYFKISLTYTSNAFEGNSIDMYYAVVI